MRSSLSVKEMVANDEADADETIRPDEMTKGKVDYIVTEGKRTSVAIHPETVRFVSYTNFWIMVLFAVVMTKFFVEPHFPGGLEKSHLVAVFGFNNVCVNWDYTPAREATAIVYPFFEIPLLIYTVVTFLRIRQLYLSGETDFSERQYKFCRVFTVLAFIGFLYFRMIFIIQVDKTAAGHTMGFFGFQIAINLLAIENFWYRKATDTHVMPRPLNTIYIIVVPIMTTIRMSYGSVILIGNGKYAVTDSGLQWLLRLFDGTWMVLVAIMPLWFDWKGRKQTEPLVLSF